MIFNFDEFNHRILNFPVVKPCNCISQKTLINSLISLATKITSFKSTNFDYPIKSNKQNSKTVIRLLQTLLVFLLELRDNAGSGSDLPESASPILLELHVILQKIRFLLEDCTCLDARVWMVTNSGSVSGQFGILIGSLVQTLEGLEIEGEQEKEYVLFLIRQGKKAKFEVEKDDLWVSRMIFSAMGEIENRVIPDPNKLRCVLDYLSINNWSDCNKQIRFIEEFGSGPETQTLMCFMIYCRCVMFHNVKNCEKKVESNDDNIGFDMGCFNPDDFKCPISLEFMDDPVTIASGHTYDRSSILEWFKSGNLTCPKTGQRLESLDLVPNLVVKQLINQYCLQKGISQPVSQVDPKHRRLTNSGCIGSLAAQECMKMVADFLSIKLAVGTMAEKNKAAYEIRLLAKRSEFNRASFLECGVVHSLLNLLLLRDSTSQENSMAALLNLSKHPKSRATIVHNGGLTLIIRVLKSGIKLESRYHAAGCLFYLSSVGEYRRLIGKIPDAIPSLVELIRVGGDQGKKNALITIFALLLLPTNYNKVLESRLIQLLVTLLGTLENKELVIDSLGVLAALAEKPDGAIAILNAGGLSVIMEILCLSSYDSSTFARENCVSLLLALSTNCGAEVVEILAKKPSLMGPLYSLITEGNSKASKKASSLIRILHEFTESRSYRSMAHALPHEHFIHVW